MSRASSNQYDENAETGHAFLIARDIAVFCPPGLRKRQAGPSLLVREEPREIRRLPTSWTVRPDFANSGARSTAVIRIGAGTSLYGTGEVTGPLLRNGRTVTLWNADTLLREQDEGTGLYQSHPWVLAVRSDGTAFGAIADTTWRLEIDLKNDIRFTSDGPPFRIIVIERQSPQEVMRGLAQLTGTMPLPPRWALGFHQSRWSYSPDSRVKEIAHEFRKRRIPCDAIWMDIDYMDGYRIFTFNPDNFPEPRALNDYLHDNGFKAVWIIDPGVKVDAGYWVYDSGCKHDVWVKTADGKEFNGAVWPGTCAFPDFTRPETREWWIELYRDFLGQGVDGVWIDMNEPDVLDGPGQTMPLDNVHRGGSGLAPGPHARYHNVYGMLMARATRDAVSKHRPGKRPFVLTRSNFLGGHRYAATWTGDNQATWEHLKTSLPMCLNLSLSGQPFCGPDIGGFLGDADEDLFAHWIALGAFYPFSRAHASVWCKDKEPWALGGEVEGVSRIALERRYRLLPYLYTLFREAATSGMPVIRPVFFADPKDMNLRAEEQAFLLGADLLVVPKWAESLRLPEGVWHSVSLVGEDSARDRYQPDLLVRGGAIIPLGRVVQNATEESLAPLTLLVCLDENGEAEGMLYEDEGDGYGYEKGHYLLTTYKARKRGARVIVGVGAEEGVMKRPDRTVNIEVVTGRGVAKSSGRERDGIGATIDT